MTLFDDDAIGYLRIPWFTYMHFARHTDDALL